MFRRHKTKKPLSNSIRENTNNKQKFRTKQKTKKFATNARFCFLSNPIGCCKIYNKTDKRNENDNDEFPSGTEPTKQEANKKELLQT